MTSTFIQLHRADRGYPLHYGMQDLDVDFLLMSRSKQAAPKRNSTIVRPRRRRQGDEARRAVAELCELRNRYYHSDAALSRALGWSPDTVAAWLSRDVARPRLDRREQVRRLLALCKSAAEWVGDPSLIGGWTLESQHPLAGRSPAEVLRVLGEEGLQVALGSLAQIAPRTSVEDLALPSAEQLRASLSQTLGEDTRLLVDRAREADRPIADLSDFD